MIGAGQWVEHDVRRDLYASFLRRPPAFYHAHRTGDLMSRATSDVSNVRALAGFGGTMLVATTLAFAGTLAAMWSIDPWLTLWALSPSPLLVLATKRFSHAVDEQSVAVQEQLGVLSAKVQENLTGMPVVRAYTMETREIESFGAAQRRVPRAQPAPGPHPGGLLAAHGPGRRDWAASIILWLGGRAVVEGRITLGAFVAFNGYLAYLAWPTVALGWTLAIVRRGMTSMERIVEILDAVPGAADRPDARSAATAPSGSPSPGAIEFRSLTFAYPDREPTLRDVSFTVPQGAWWRWWGRRAAASPRSARWSAGCTSRRAARSSWAASTCATCRRRRCGGASAMSRRRRSSSRARCGTISASRTTTRPTSACARRRVTAGLAEEVEALPGGWDTVVGERGLTLSGGQRQRAALARALLGDPAYLILDDVFASVDPGKEAEILRSLARRAPRAHHAGHHAPAPGRGDRRPGGGAGRGAGGRAGHATTTSSRPAGSTRGSGAPSRSRPSLTRPDDHDEILGKAYDARLMARLWAVTRPHKRLVLVSLVLFPLTAAAELLQPYLVKVAIDHHILAGDWRGLGADRRALPAHAGGALRAPGRARPT